MNYGDFPIEETIHVFFTTRAFATGIPGTLSAATVAVYEDITATPIETSIAVTESLNSIAGLNAVPIVAIAASGYEVGKNYHVVIESGTVDSVSVVGEVVAYFSIGRSAAAVDLANATDGLGALKDETALIVADTAEIGAAGAGLTDLGGMSAGMKGEVNDEVDTALATTTYAEPAQGLPAATTTLANKIGFLYKAWRNKSDQTATTYQLYNDDAATVDHKATVSDDATTATKGEIATGP